MHSSEWGPEFFEDRVDRALKGDQIAWNELCAALNGVAWKVIMNFGLRGQQADDAFAASLLQLAAHLKDVREPPKLPGWYAKTVKSQCVNVIRHDWRHVPASPMVEQHEQVTHDDLEDVTDDGMLDAVYRALAELSEACRNLIRLLTAVPVLSYADIAEELGMPIGGIGPNRQRCLGRLRKNPAVARYLSERMP